MASKSLVQRRKVLCYVALYVSVSVVSLSPAAGGFVLLL
jgi:hypothetical protein